MKSTIFHRSHAGLTATLLLAGILTLMTQPKALDATTLRTLAYH